MSDELKDIICKLLEKDPKKRLGLMVMLMK